MKKKKKKRVTYVIAHYNQEEAAAAIDYDVERSQLLTDAVFGDLLVMPGET